jgi:hypothetical protein
MRALQTLALLLALGATACASTWRTVYAGSSAAADFIDRTHARAWSEPLNKRADECEETLPEDRISADVDACLGVYTRNPDVLAALERYNAAADVLAAVLLATDPEAKDQAAILAAWADVLAAARDLLALFPDADKHLRQLDTLTGKAR